MSDEVTTPPKCDGCDDHYHRLIRHNGTGEMHRITCPCRWELPVKFLFQTWKASCMATCAAMVAGISEDEMIRQYYQIGHDWSAEGSSLDEALAILDKHFGFAYQTRYPGYQPTRAKRDPWPCEPWADLHICQVTNLRNANQHGVILLRSGLVLDPACGVIAGLHMYPKITSISAVYKVN